MMAQATLLICDDVRFEANGKMMLIGVYTSDLSIPVIPFLAPQLFFVLDYQCPIEETPDEMTLEITIPLEQKAFVWTLRDLKKGVPSALPGRTQSILKQAFPIFFAELRPGQIKARLLFNDKELKITASWIIHTPLPDSLKAV